MLVCKSRRGQAFSRHARQSQELCFCIAHVSGTRLQPTMTRNNHRQKQKRSRLEREIDRSTVMNVQLERELSVRKHLLKVHQVIFVCHKVPSI